MNYEERFAELKKLIKAKRPKLEASFAIQVNMTDSDCHGTFYIAYTDGTLKVEPYDYRDRTAMITADSHVLEELLQGTLTAAKAYEDGKIIIDGSLDSAKELLKLCRKAPAKKAPAKKAEPKKSEPKAEASAKCPKKTCKKKAEK